MGSWKGTVEKEMDTEGNSREGDEHKADWWVHGKRTIEKEMNAEENSREGDERGREQ